MWAKGKDRDKAYARAVGMGMIPSTRPGHTAFEALGPKRPPAVVVLTVIEAIRFLRGGCNDDDRLRCQRSWALLCEHYTEPVAHAAVECFEAPTAPCMSLPARKADTARYKLYVEPVLPGERVYLFTGSV